MKLFVEMKSVVESDLISSGQCLPFLWHITPRRLYVPETFLRHQRPTVSHHKASHASDLEAQ